MSAGKVDVLAVMDSHAEYARTMFTADLAREAVAARDAVAKLIAAATAYRAEILNDTGHRGDLAIRLDDAIAAVRP